MKGTLRQRTILLWLAGLMMLGAARLGPVARASDFDLEQRKARLAWIWIPPAREPTPPVARSDWPFTDVDRFVLARLEAAGLTPAAPADERTWLRRVHSALTGLPPSREAVQSFVEDTSPGKRERVVDQLLASPHYGERWARHWMDLVRYAETRGHEHDHPIANAWQYRDYLIRAFNLDLPYNQLVREHVAGDLVTPPRLDPKTGANESVLGTGWAFLGEEIHSPVDIRQDECERIDNKVDVFSKTFLGLTVSCARCHDHKFDALQTRDYYALAGFFLSSSYRQVRFESSEHNRRVAAEVEAWRESHRQAVTRDTAAQLRASLSDLARYLEVAREILAQPEGGRVARRDGLAAERGLDPARVGRWMEYLASASERKEDPLHGVAQLLRDGGVVTTAQARERLASRMTWPTVELPDAARVLVDYRNGPNGRWMADGVAFGSGPVPAGTVVLGSTEARPLEKVLLLGAARRDPFWNQLRTSPDNESESGAHGSTARAGQMIRTATFELGVGRLHYLIQGKGQVYAGVDSHIMIAGPLHGRLVREIDSGDAPGPRWIMHDLTPYQGHRTHLEFSPAGPGDFELLMVVESEQTLAPPEPVVVSLPEGGDQTPWVEALQASMTDACEALEKGGFTPAQVVQVNWMLAHPQLLGDRPAPSEPVREFVRGLDHLRQRARWESRTAVAWLDGTGVDEHVLLRGKPQSPGDVAVRRLPEALDVSRPITVADSSGRLALAVELTDPANPLVPRVIVNRVWHHLFGRGIVASVDNFGWLGDRPTHPELLDRLAWEFVHEDHGSLKSLIKRLVLSRTYAMSSADADPDRAREVDPSNALLHRMPVRRLEGEEIRDALLAVSGRLNDTMYGPPVPVHLTDFLTGRGRPGQSGPVDGHGRRSLYIAVRRNFVPMLMSAFDRPTPFSTRGRRDVTNVPAQALVRMNDALFHGQAGVWARRMLAETEGAAPGERVAWLFESAYARPPAEAETTACLETLAALEPGRGEASVEDWTQLCHALLNANEFIYLR